MIGGFTWGSGGEATTPEEARRRREYAMAMIQAGTANKPIQHWTQGAAGIAQALLGAYEMNLADKSEKDARAKAAESDKATLSALTGGGLAPSPVAAPAAAPDAGAGVGGAGMRSPGMAGVVAGKAPNDLMPMFVKHEQEKGLPQGYLSRTAEIESRFDPNAKNPNSSATGLFQFINSTAQQYGLNNPRDPAASTEAAARLASDNRAQLLKALGREPTAGELYLAHQQGGGGASKLLANPNARAVDIVGADAVRLNGGNANMTAGEFANKWVSKFGGGQPQPAPSLQPPQAPAGVSQSQIAAAMQTLNNPYSTPGAKMVAQSLVQRAVTAEAKDPRDGRLKDLTIAEKEAAIQQQRQLNPLAVQEKQLGIKKTQRELEGEGATPLTPEERKQIGVPEGQPAYKERSGKIIFGPAGTKIVNEAQKQETEFGKETGKALAKRFDQLATDGDEAVQNLQVLSELKRLGGKIDFGSSATVKSALGRLGLKTEGVSDIEAFETLINRLTPQQRVAGSGATSDFDAKMFRDSLPRLMNTTEGNQLVIDTLEALQQNKIARGDIAMRVQMGEIKPADAIREIRQLQSQAREASNRIRDFGKQQGPRPEEAVKPQQPQPAPSADGWIDRGNGIRIRKVP